VPTLGEVDPAEGWSFLDTFDVEEPWGQRNLNAFCSELTPNLEVVQDWCWMKLFRMWHIEKYQRFPTRKAMFIPRLKEFLGEGSHHAPYNQYIWWNDDQTRVQATYFSYMMGVPKVVSSSRALKLKSAWDGYVSTFDGQASAHVKGAIAVSRLWVEPEAERELLSSSVSTIIVLVVLAFMGMLLFTFSIMLSLFVVLVTLGVVAGLAFFLVIVANWTVGLVEGVAIIYFVGYAVTYALHIAHKYGTGGEVTRSFVLADEDLTNERLTRTIHALTSIGGVHSGNLQKAWYHVLGCDGMLHHCCFWPIACWSSDMWTTEAGTWPLKDHGCAVAKHSVVSSEMCLVLQTAAPPPHTSRTGRPSALVPLRAKSRGIARPSQKPR